MLTGKFALHEVQDVEALCSVVVRESGVQMDCWMDRDDLVQFLMIEAWKIAQAYEPSTPPRFAVYLKRTLRLRLVDFQRQQFRTRWVSGDRVYERPRPSITSLDGVEHGLEVDDPADQLADLDWILGERVGSDEWA